MRLTRRIYYKIDINKQHPQFPERRYVEHGAAGLNDGLFSEWRREAGLNDRNCGLYRSVVGKNVGEVGEYHVLIREYPKVVG